MSEVCNADLRPFEETWVTVVVRGRAFGFQVLTQGDLGPLAPCDCVTLESRRTMGEALGDVVITAEVGVSHDDVDRENNEDSREDFVLVGGLGFGVGKRTFPPPRRGAA